MIILAPVISSTVSNVLLGSQSAFTVPSYDLKSAAVTDQGKENEAYDTRGLARGYTSISPPEDKAEGGWRAADGEDDLELSALESVAGGRGIGEELLLEDLKVSRAMSQNYVKVSPPNTLKEAAKRMQGSQQKCALVVDDNDFLEGILTPGDIRRCVSKNTGDSSKGDLILSEVHNTSLVSSACTRRLTYRGKQRGLLTCCPDSNLEIAKELMKAREMNQLPVTKRSSNSQKGSKKLLLYFFMIQSGIVSERR